MCTSVCASFGDRYFGRNLDVELSYGESIVIMPRGYNFNFRKVKYVENPYAIIGMAKVVEGVPLFFDAFNEKGLAMAGLAFEGNADYKPEYEGVDNIASFELIPWILLNCKNVKEAKYLLKKINVTDISFSEKLPPSPLHFMISDKECSIVLECVKEGVMVYDNPLEVLTNNPPFPYQLFNLNNYMSLSADPPKNNFGIPLNIYSRWMGAMGLPGDLSSQSRFVKAAFTKLNSYIPHISEKTAVSQFFHILYSVYQQKGCARLDEGLYEYTEYSSCCNLTRGIYYYTTYENSQITAIDMYKENLSGNTLIEYPLITENQILNIN